MSDKPLTGTPRKGLGSSPRISEHEPAHLRRTSDGCRVYGSARSDIVGGGRQANDHAVILWVNLPSCGILGVARYEYMITAVSNLLAVHKRNGIALIIHPNRAGQMFDRLGCIWDLLWDLSLACSYMSGHEPCFKRC